MAFTVEGSIRKRKYSVTWEGPDKLSGDRLAVDLTYGAAKAKRSVKGPVGMYFSKDKLKTALAAQFTIESVFTSVDKVTGDIEIAPVEEGAVM